MHEYSQVATTIDMSYSTNLESKVVFRDSEHLFETEEEIDFEFDLELS
jgi:hypothetical protein